ncbi:unnamed protein product, partial [Rotaria socialis]
TIRPAGDCRSNGIKAFVTENAPKKLTSKLSRIISNGNSIGRGSGK